MYLQLDTFAPHSPQQYSKRYADAYRNARAPRSPSTNENNVSDKPEWVRRKSKKGLRTIDAVHRERLRSLRMADDLVGDVVRALRKSGELRNSYIVFTSDNGWHNAEHRIYGKWTPYEEAIRVPTVVRGPGVPENVTRKEFVLNNDWAPTFAELGGAKTPKFVDGTSIAPLLRGDNPEWRNKLLLQSFRRTNDLNTSPAPSYTGIRSLNFKWTEYRDDDGDVIDRELYAFKRDRYELRSLHHNASRNLKRNLDQALADLVRCEAESCREAEGFPTP